MGEEESESGRNRNCSPEPHWAMVLSSSSGIRKWPWSSRFYPWIHNDCMIPSSSFDSFIVSMMSSGSRPHQALLPGHSPTCTLKSVLVSNVASPCPTRFISSCVCAVHSTGLWDFLQLLSLVICSFTHSFKEHRLSTCHVAGTVPATRYISNSKTNTCPITYVEKVLWTWIKGNH